MVPANGTVVHRNVYTVSEPHWLSIPHDHNATPFHSFTSNWILGVLADVVEAICSVVIPHRTTGRLPIRAAEHANVTVADQRSTCMEAILWKPVEEG